MADVNDNEPDLENNGTASDNADLAIERLQEEGWNDEQSPSLNQRKLELTEKVVGQFNLNFTFPSITAHHDSKQYHQEIVELGDSLAVKTPAQMDALSYLCENSRALIYEIRLQKLVENAAHHDHPSFAQASKAWMYEPNLSLDMAIKIGSQIKHPWQALAIETALDQGFEQDFKRKGSIFDYFNCLATDESSQKNFLDRFGKLINGKAEDVLIHSRHATTLDMVEYRHPKLDKASRELLASTIDGLFLTDKNKVYDSVRSVSTKTFTEALNYLNGSSQSHSNPHSYEPQAALRLALTFKDDWQKWLNVQEKLGRSPHEATHWLPAKTFDPDPSRWLFECAKADLNNKNNPQYEAKNVDDLSVVASKWNELKDWTETAKNEKGKIPYKLLVKKARSVHYDNVKDETFAQVAHDYAIPAESYTELENVWLGSRITPSPFPLEKKWQVGDLTGEFLPRDSVQPIGLLAGNEIEMPNGSKCCQRPGAPGASCARYGQEKPNSGFFVVRDGKQNIVGLSWAWISDNGGLCFDNIEISSKEYDHQIRDKQVVQILEKAAADLSSTYHTVTLGKQYTRIPTEQWTAAGEKSLTLPGDYRGYTDTFDSEGKNVQVILAENTNIAKTNKSPFPIWVRGGNNSDHEAIKNVVEKCYPQGWQWVDDLNKNSIVLETRQNGIVGYVAFDSKNKYIADFAIAPAFRNKDNSLKLMNALSQHIEQEGGEWHAQCRESTSYNLLKLQEKRGLIKFVHETAKGKMGNEQMYEVVFRAATVEEKESFQQAKRSYRNLAEQVFNQLPGGKIPDNADLALAIDSVMADTQISTIDQKYLDSLKSELGQDNSSTVKQFRADLEKLYTRENTLATPKIIVTSEVDNLPIVEITQNEASHTTLTETDVKANEIFVVERKNQESIKEKNGAKETHELAKERAKKTAAAGSKITLALILAHLFLPKNEARASHFSLPKYSSKK